MSESGTFQNKASRTKTASSPVLSSVAHAAETDFLDESLVQRSLRAPQSLAPGDIQRLQRTLGNQAVQRMLADAGHAPTHEVQRKPLSPRIQRHPGHGEEEQVRRKTLTPQIQRHPQHAEEEEVQRTSLSPRIQRHPGHGEEEEVRRKTLMPHIQRHPQHAEEEEVQRKAIFHTGSKTESTIQRAGIFSTLGKGGKWLGQKALQTGAGLLGGIGGGIAGTLAGVGGGAYSLGKKGWNKGGNLFTKAALALGGGLAGAVGGSVYGMGVGTALGATRGWEGAKFAKGTSAKEANLSARYAVPIGGDNKHFNADILKELEQTLGQLPEGNVEGSWLRKGGIAPDTGTGSLASFYSYDDNSISVGSPWWLPKKWHRNMRIGKKTAGLLDSDQAAVMMDALSIRARYPSKEDQEQGGGLSIFRGIGDVHEGRKLMPYTIRHEMGHAIDHKIGFTKNRGRLKQFGGWIQHGGDQSEAGLHGDPQADQVVQHFMAMVGLPQQHLKAPDRMFTSVKDMLEMVKMGTPLPNDLDRYVDSGNNTAISGDTVQKMRQAERKIIKARNSPWMLTDGGAGDLEHNGRVVHLDHYNTWVSYDAEARRSHGVSNYQFSSPGEWFAEAYAVYYEPEQSVGDRGRARLNETTKSWMRKNLGPYPGQEDEEDQRGELVVPPEKNHGKYWLEGLNSISVEKMAELNAEGDDIDQPLPVDLQDIL